MTPKEKNSSLTAEWLRDNMSYDPLTGAFAWTKPGQGRTVGKQIGSTMWSGGNTYLTMKVDGTVYYAHRIAWLYHYGEWPSASVDHIDENRSNNAIANLRIATHAQNSARRNTVRMIGPSRGVFPHGAGFVARLHHAGVRHYLGYFANADDAKAAYEAKAREIHGEFAHPEEENSDRSDFMNAVSCEICGSSDKLVFDRTILGTPRGKLCVSCSGFILSHGTDPQNIRSFARKAIEYVQKLDVPEDVIPETARQSAPVPIGLELDE